MRITLESTVSEPEYSIKAVVETAQDGYLIDEMIGYIKQILSGYGFADKSINQAIIEEGIMLQDELDKREKVENNGHFNDIPKGLNEVG